jgi:hypothetical protein
MLPPPPQEITMIAFRMSRKKLLFFLYVKLRMVYVGFEVFRVVVFKSIIFWNMAPCSPLSFNRRFGGTYRLHHQGRRNMLSKPASKQVERWRRFVPPKRWFQYLSMNSWNGRMINELERVMEGSDCALERYCPGIYLKGLRKPTKNNVQSSRCPDHNSNRGLPKCNSKVITLGQPVQLVHHNIYRTNERNT